MKVKIHHEGTNILIILALMLAVINALAWLFIRPVAVPIVFSSLSLVMYLLVLNFFRSPRRSCPGLEDNDLVVSSVDGTVVALEEVRENVYLHDRAIMVSVFMTVFNVHANWYPVNGTVKHVKHFPGRFLSAYLPKASVENERSSVFIETFSGKPVVVNQIAGAVARRIVTYAEAGDACTKEEHMGFIKFGSRVDIYLPADTLVLVKIGDKTTGGVTPLARLQLSATSPC